MSDKDPAPRRDLLLRQIRDALILLASTQYASLKRLFQPELEKLAIDSVLWPKRSSSACPTQDPSYRRGARDSIAISVAVVKDQPRDYLRGAECRYRQQLPYPASSRATQASQPREARTRKRRPGVDSSCIHAICPGRACYQ